MKKDSCLFIDFLSWYAALFNSIVICQGKGDISLDHSQFKVNVAIFSLLMCHFHLLLTNEEYFNCILQPHHMFTPYLGQVFLYSLLTFKMALHTMRTTHTKDSSHIHSTIHLLTSAAAASWPTFYLKHTTVSSISLTQLPYY